MAVQARQRQQRQEWRPGGRTPSPAECPFPPAIHVNSSAEPSEFLCNWRGLQAPRSPGASSFHRIVASGDPEFVNIAPEGDTGMEETLPLAKFPQTGGRVLQEEEDVKLSHVRLGSRISIDSWITGSLSSDLCSSWLVVTLATPHPSGSGFYRTPGAKRFRCK